MIESEWVVLGLSEDEIWAALEEAFEKKHGVSPDLNHATLHGTADRPRPFDGRVPADQDVTLVYTSRVLVEEYEDAMLEKLVPPLPKETP